VYKTVKIGEQVWMAENLAYNQFGSKCYNNEYGRLYDWDTAMEACPEGWHLPSDEEWQALENFARGKEFIEIAGKKLKAQTGWYEKRTYELGLSEEDAKEDLRNREEWSEENGQYEEEEEVELGLSEEQLEELKDSEPSEEDLESFYNGTDDFGFAALPSGYSELGSGYLRKEGSMGGWWSASNYNIYIIANAPSSNGSDCGNYSANRYDLYSVRCVKD